MTHPTDPSARARPSLSDRIVLGGMRALWGFALLATLALGAYGFQRLAGVNLSVMVGGHALLALPLDVAVVLRTAGIPSGWIEGLYYVGRLLGFAAFLLTGIVVFARAHRDRTAIVVSTMLLTVGVALFVPLELVTAKGAVWAAAARVVGRAAAPWTEFGRSLAGVTLMLTLLRFPDGSWTPRWTRWFAYTMLASIVAWVLLPDLFDPRRWPRPLEAAWVLAVPAVGLGAQAYRYWFVSDGEDRRKARLVVLAAAVAAGAAVLLTVFDLELGSGLFDLGLVTPVTAAVYDIMLLIALGAALVLLPVSIAWSMQRYELFDVSSIINRALVYAVVTGVVAGTGVLLVAAISWLLGDFVGQAVGERVGLVGSAVLMTLAFGPVRRRVQTLIDRAFYRQRYDAGRTLEEFGSRAVAVDLGALEGELLAVVDRTMRPSQVGLWVREGSRGEAEAAG